MFFSYPSCASGEGERALEGGGGCVRGGGGVKGDERPLAEETENRSNSSTTP